MIAALLVAANFSGGRAMSTREESAAGRLDAWSEGIDMYRSNPVLGVGFHNFVEHHERTAHNSFVLCFAELGTVGYFFWLGLLTVPILQLKQVSHCIPNDLDGGPLRPYPRVLLASFSGILVAAVFLSRTYTPVLYLFVGLADALFAIARNSGEPIKMPGLCALGRRVVALEFASIIAVYVFIRLNRLLL
jgi:hypothetical protein